MFCLFKMQFHILSVPSFLFLYYNHLMFVIAKKLKDIMTYDITYSEIDIDFLSYGLDILLQDGLEYAGALTAGILMHRESGSILLPGGIRHSPYLYRRSARFRKARMLCGIHPDFHPFHACIGSACFRAVLLLYRSVFDLRHTPQFACHPSSVSSDR